jgi:putative peptide zinc metalloprotease protein
MHAREHTIHGVSRGREAQPETGKQPVFELVLPDQRRIPIVRDMTIGRGPDSTVRLGDPTVSRRHARISPGGSNDGAPVLEDAGSSYGTFVDGRRIAGAESLQDGARIRLGNEELVLERRRSETEAGRTILVPPGASRLLPSHRGSATLGDAGGRPRLRSGYALKRLAASDGPRRWVLKDVVGENLVRLSDEDGQLLELLDGRHALPELIREAERRFGSTGGVRLAQVLADLDSRGLLAGSNAPTQLADSGGVVQRLLRPRQLEWPTAGDFFDRLYRDGGWVLFTRVVAPLIGILIALGLCVFVYLVAGRYGTPFVVAKKVGLGGLVFILGRFAVAAVHETAHGLAMAAFGRRVGKAGLKLLLIFPYVYVDTSEIWFEPRRRRVAVTAAGPASDFSLGAFFSVCCLLLPAGTSRDVFFQLAFAAYVGGLFNLNPLLERDGYQILVDVLGEPKLRRRALEQLKRELQGDQRDSDSPVLARYSIFALGWWVVAGSFAAGLSVRYVPILERFVPHPAAWALLAGLWIALFVPVVAIVGPPLRARRRLEG